MGLKTNKIVQFAVGATVAAQLLVKVKSEGLGPPRETDETWSAAVPVLMTVRIWAAPVVPCVIVGKEGTVGENVMAGAGATPVPVRARVCGLPGALSTTWKVAESGPALAGVKVILTEQFALGARVFRQVLDCEKLEAFVPTIEMELMVKA